MTENQKGGLPAEKMSSIAGISYICGVIRIKAWQTRTDIAFHTWMRRIIGVKLPHVQGMRHLPCTA